MPEKNFLSENIWYRNFSSIKGGHHGFLESFFSHSTETFRKRTPLCFRKNPVPKKIMDESGKAPFSVEILLFHSTENFRRGTRLCFGNFLLSKRFLYTKGEGVPRFYVTNLLFDSTENFVGEPFSVSLISDLDKFYA